jgi:hypothetical protein
MMQGWMKPPLSIPRLLMQTVGWREGEDEMVEGKRILDEDYRKETVGGNVEEFMESLSCKNEGKDRYLKGTAG